MKNNSDEDEQEQLYNLSSDDEKPHRSSNKKKLEAPTNEHIQKEGFLVEVTESQDKLRWVTLYESCIVFSNSENKEKLKRVIRCERLREVLILEDEILAVKHNGIKYSCSFGLASTKKDYLLAAPNLTERDLWVKLINREIESIKQRNNRKKGNGTKKAKNIKIQISDASGGVTTDNNNYSSSNHNINLENIDEDGSSSGNSNVNSINDDPNLALKLQEVGKRLSTFSIPFDSDNEDDRSKSPNTQRPPKAKKTTNSAAKIFSSSPKRQSGRNIIGYSTEGEIIVSEGSYSYIKSPPKSAPDFDVTQHSPVSVTEKYNSLNLDEFQEPVQTKERSRATSFSAANLSPRTPQKEKKKKAEVLKLPSFLKNSKKKEEK